MIQFIKKLIFAWKYKRAIKKAVKLANLTGRKYYVIRHKGELKVVPKRTLKRLIAYRRFRKGVSIHDIEKSALFVTK